MEEKEIINLISNLIKKGYIVYERKFENNIVTMVPKKTKEFDNFMEELKNFDENNQALIEDVVGRKITKEESIEILKIFGETNGNNG